MPYYIRVLGENEQGISVSQLRDALEGAGLRAEILVEVGTDDDWEQLVVRHPAGSEILVAEKNPVRKGELGDDELGEFMEEVGHYRPESASRWLKEYLLKVKVIYALQLLDGTDVNDGWEIVHTVQSGLWSTAGGILQADGEGFSNLDGYGILWQFSDSVKGDWNMAVLDQSGHWVPFTMDLGNLAQRDAFLSGRVPEGAKLI